MKTYLHKVSHNNMIILMLEICISLYKISFIKNQNYKYLCQNRYFLKVTYIVNSFPAVSVNLSLITFG